MTKVKLADCVELLAGFAFTLPSVPVQRRIAGILSAYDELMENGQRRIRILEEMARALYREWFVHFRFPGHEKAARVDSRLGDIPEGREAGRLDDVLVLQRGFDLPKADRMEGTIPIFAATGVTGFHNEAKVKPPGVVTGRSGTIGDVIYVQEDFWPLNTALWVKEFPKSEPLYAYFVLSSLDLKQFNSGAAVPTLNRNDIHGLDVLIPPPPLQKRFQQIAGAMLAQIRTLELKTENLRRTRDLLLPRLLSGQVPPDVSADVAEPTPSAPPPRLPRSQTPFGNALTGETPFRGGRGARVEAEEATELRGQGRAQIEFGHEEGGEEPALRVAEGSARAPRVVFGAHAEDSSPARTASLSRKTAASPAGIEVPGEAPDTTRGARALPVTETECTDVLQIIRQVFSEGPPRPRDDAIRDVARALGYRRTGARIQSVLHADLLTAVRRGILENTGGTLRLCTRSITDLARDFLKAQFLAAIGRPWIDRDTATRGFCRWLGFARTGPVIEDPARSLIHRLLREGRLEADGAELIRRV